ncbi:glycoside hydrolase family 10 [Isosphaera pallida ATCC 43644]|uniref:Glycoside hydrolase family 10 n=1 Tax=Isosphaera pallida (strain ATCC 43644 / DSM 9630 / IS1B) TaxID=575540 RepID=E8R166_ISOPI|nr:endo-1,4-beta-xylanase [Isosphaera pallida]ADV61272.1 glycoside hydrolase family 10 [Isosphaera pallida ATCC 43644]
MGTHKFRLPPSDILTPPVEVRRGYLVGPDRTPIRTMIEVRPGQLLCHRDITDSGRLQLPWPIPGHGLPVVGTATLSERATPYDLVVELARGRLNDLRNQIADWSHHLGMSLSPDLRDMMRESQRLFSQAALAQDDPETSHRLAEASLIKSFEAGELATRAYARLLLDLRHQHQAKLPTLLGCQLDGDPQGQPWAVWLPRVVNAARVHADWNAVSPAEGQYLWNVLDAQMEYARGHNLTITAGPLIELRSPAWPDWLVEHQNDPQTMLDIMLDWVRANLVRYRGKVAVWNLVSRIGSPDALGLSEEEQIEVAARIVQTARTVDPHAQLIVEFDRPWAESLGAPSATHQYPPLHLGDYLARNELGLSGIGLEIAVGYAPPGGLMRDLLEFSKLLDLYSLLNMPLHLTFAVPSAVSNLNDADTLVTSPAELAQGFSTVAEGTVLDHHWPEPPTEATQRDFASDWVELAVSKPYVRSITWIAASDASPCPYPASGLFRADGSPKPIVEWLAQFRTNHLA